MKTQIDLKIALSDEKNGFRTRDEVKAIAEEVSKSSNLKEAEYARGHLKAIEIQEEGERNLQNNVMSE